MSRIKKHSILGIVALIGLSPAIGLAVLSLLAKKPQGLGVVNGRLAPCPRSPNCVCTQAIDPSHRIEPIPFEGPADQVVKRLEAAMTRIPRMRVVTEKEDYIHAEATSRIFRFIDDVEFFVDRDAKLIHFRSASRVGHSDLGVNRSRMERIRRAFLQVRILPL
jgi:uncharacterized protein (DUF1499 family)